MSDGMASGGRDGGAVTGAGFVLGEEPGAIVAGFDVHRRQITVDALDSATGEVWRGQIESTPAAVEEWVAGFPGRVVHVAVEACTGWLFVSRALAHRGATAHLAEPVETSALRGRKRRAKTDRADAKWLRELLCQGRLPEAWLPPEQRASHFLCKRCSECNCDSLLCQWLTVTLQCQSGGVGDAVAEVDSEGREGGAPVVGVPPFLLGAGDREVEQLAG